MLCIYEVQVGLALVLLIIGVLAACTTARQEGGAPEAIRHVRRLLSFRDGQAVTRGIALAPLHMPPGCLHLRDVCADQQSLVLFRPQYRPDAPRPVSIPVFAPTGAKYNFPWLAQSNPDPLVRMKEWGPHLEGVRRPPFCPALIPRDKFL